MIEEYIGWLDDEWNTVLDQSQPIVRCRDCKKCNIGWCLHFNNVVKPDGFCAWGEARERESVEVWNQWSTDDATCSEES